MRTLNAFLSIRSNQSMNTCHGWAAAAMVSLLLLGPATDVRAVPNDTCATAIALTNEVALALDVSDATLGPEETATCRPDLLKGIWFTFTAPGSGPLTITTIDSSVVTVVQVFTGSCGSLTPLTCDDSTSLASYLNRAGVIFNASAGTTYYVLTRAALSTCACQKSNFLSVVVAIPTL